MKKTIILIILICSWTVQSQNNELKSFMEELFFNLPSEASKIEIVKEVNSNRFLQKAEVHWINTSSKIIDNAYLTINNTGELLIFFDDNEKYVSGYKIVLNKEKGEANAQTVINLLNSFDLRDTYNENIEYGQNITTYAFFTKTNDRAFCIIEVRTEAGGSIYDFSKPSMIWISYNPQYLK